MSRAPRLHVRGAMYHVTLRGSNRQNIFFSHADMQLMSNRINAERVRYIKLGVGGDWAEECIHGDRIRIGFWTDTYFDLCVNREWDRLAAVYRDEKEKSKRTASRFVGEVRAFFEDVGRTMWITFHNRKMYWTFLDPNAVPHRASGEGTVRVALPWSCRSLGGAELWMVELSGGLTKTAAYRGTSCEVEDPDYVIRRVNDEQRTETLDAKRAVAELEGILVRLMRLLTPPDFELLVDLIFSASGWRRRGVLGGPQDTVDIELELPSTGDRAFVQVKSSTNQNEFLAYAEAAERSGIERMFFAYHSGSAHSEDSRIKILGPDELARMTIEAGLVSWLMKKAG